MSMVSNRLEQQMAFILEIDKLEASGPADSYCGRHCPENSAEHSWHIALMALLMVEHIDQRSI